MKTLLAKTLSCGFLLSIIFMIGCGGPMKQGQKYFQAGLYDDAVRSFQQAVRKKPNDPEARIALEQAKNKAAETHYNIAVKAHEKRAWSLAAKEYKIALQFVEGYQDAKQRLQVVESSEALEHYEKAVAFQENGNWDAALEAFEASLELVHNYKDSYKRIDAVKESAAEEHYQTGVRFESDERWSEALQAYEKVENYIPNYKDVREHVTLAHQSLASQFYDQGLVAQEAQKWQDAYNVYKQAESHVPNYEDLQTRIQTVAYEVAKGHVEEGDSYIAQVDTKGRRTMGQQAKSCYEAALHVCPTYEGIHQKIGYAQNLMIIRVAIQPLKGRQPAASQITNGITSSLVQRAPKDRIQVVERTQLDAIFRELGLAGQDPLTAAQTGKIKGVNVLFVGEVLEFNVTSKTDTEEKTETKFDPKRPEGQRQYTVTYNNYKKNKDAFLKVSFRLINAETATIEATDDFEAKASASTYWWREGQEEPKIKSDQELTAEVVNKAVAQFTNEIIRRYR